jgi:hypothetical protein
MHVILAEDLFARPGETMSQIFSFLGVDPAFATDQKYEVFNDAPTGKEQEVDTEVRKWLVDHYRPFNRALEGFLGRSLAAWSEIE